MFRQTVFWLHLCCGVTAGVVVLMMSATGVLLTYERQILGWAERAQSSAPAAGAARRPLAELIAAAARERPGFQPNSMTVRNDPTAPVTLVAGRAGALLVDPYSGAVREAGPSRLRDFFETVESWHRWFNVSGEKRATARAITGACNLLFLVLVSSGVYLWLPRVWKWAALKTRLWFNPKVASSKARDFNWHHVFGIWSAVPLAVVVASAVVFSYPWANDLVYRAVGEQPPVRGGPPGGGPRPGAARAATSERDAATRLAYDELFARAAEHGPWQTLTLLLPPGGMSDGARFTVDEGNGGQPQRRHTLTLDAATGAVQSWAPFASQPLGQRARIWIRFLHTGEALGLAGQTIAGLVSLTSLIMVWTGLALAWRRLIVPLFRRPATNSAA
jgi:uncharacterized iron-regulated membrane protein